jgi:soluble lytic murein transglycosylase
VKRFNRLFVWLSFFFLCGPLGAQDKAPKDLFAEAYALYVKKDFDQAEAMFAVTLGREWPLEDYSLYYLSDMALARGDPQAAVQYLRQIPQRFPQSIWSLRAELGIAKTMLAAKDYSSAVEKVHQILNRSGEREISGEAMLVLARLNELQGNSKEAYGLYQDLRQSSPLSPWAAEARAQVKRLRQNQPQQFGLATAEALAEEADFLYRERQLDEAAQLYRRLLKQAPPRGRERVQLLKKLAQVYLDGRRREEAIPVLDEIVREHGASPEAPEAVYNLARVYWNRDENLKALDHFNQLQARYPQSSFNDFAHFASARIHETLGKPDEARRLYESFPAKYPNSQLRDDAAWTLGWLLYLQADYPGAHRVFKSIAEAGRARGFTSAALYWRGRTAERMGQLDEARAAFLRIAQSPEESYYTGPAIRRLERIGVGRPERASKRADLEAGNAPSLDRAGAFHLVRAQELADLALHELAVRELDALRSLAGLDPSVRLFLVRAYARNRAFARSVALASQFPEKAEELSRFRYPLAYWESIRSITEKTDLDPYLVVALIRQESLFDPRAVSPASAYGLMQLLPSTAARMAKQLSLDSFSAERLFDPELNLRLGTRYLTALLRQFPQSLPKAIAAYNAGENAVARWEKQIAAQDEEEFIERIPYAETRLYVKLVLRNHRIYSRIYNSHR